MLKPLIRTTVLALALTAAVVAVPAPAQSADGYWSATSCYAGPPVNSEYYGIPGVGSKYRNAYSYAYANAYGTNPEIYFVQTAWQYYRVVGYECGFLGLPFFYSTSGSTKAYWMLKPGDCTMRILFMTGSTVAVQEYPRYWC